MNAPQEFDQAHTKKLNDLWQKMSEDPWASDYDKKAKECRMWAMFCAGIVDSLFHKLKTDQPEMVKGFKGFTIPR